MQQINVNPDTPSIDILFKAQTQTSRELPYL